MNHRLRVREVVQETHDAVSLVFELPAAQASAFRHRPGQFLTLHLPLEPGRVLRRCYSMSSAPGLDEGWLRVTVKRVAQGRGSNWVCDRIRAGDEVQVSPPAGVFSPRSLDGDFVLLGGGSGITPLFSILRSVLAHGGTGRVLLFYANRDERSVIFAAALRALAAEHPQRLQAIHWLDSVQGPPGVGPMAALLRPWAAAQAYVCGPGPFMDAACTALREAGAAAEHVHVERFVSLPDEDPAGDDRAATQPSEPAAVASAQLRIELDGAEHHIACAGTQTLLQAARQAGIELPHSCEAGMCASCMCQVVEGRVHLRHNEALDERDLARSWTLACQATPATAQVHIKFPQ